MTRYLTLYKQDVRLDRPRLAALRGDRGGARGADRRRPAGERRRGSAPGPVGDLRGRHPHPGPGHRVPRRRDFGRCGGHLRNSEDILDIIFLIGGLTSFFEFEEVTINKEIRNKINRNMNWEIANETKKLSAVEKQIRIINKIDEEIGLKELSEVLRETAVNRLKNEEMSLQELADLMSISKSGIKNRFRRLEEIYKNLSENRGEN